MREIVEQVPIGLFNTNYRLDKTSEMVGPEQGPIQLFSTIKDDIAKMEKGYLIITQWESLHIMDIAIVYSYRI